MRGSRSGSSSTTGYCNRRDRGVAITDVRDGPLTVEKCCFWVTTSPGSATGLYGQHVCEDTLDVWPAALPLFIRADLDYPIESVDNINAVLERRDCVRLINLMSVPSYRLETLSAAMQKLFPDIGVM